MDAYKKVPQNLQNGGESVGLGDKATNLPQEEPWVSIEGTLYDLARRKATVQETLQLIRKYTTMENRIPTPHSDHIGKAADMIEEPWVAELEALKIVVETYESDHGKTTEYYLHNEGKEYDRLKSFIQKTLEADRKEMAGVVLREVKEGLPEFEVDTAGGKRTVIMKDDLEGLLEDVMK